MPVQLPNLDDRTYPDLVEEARRLIITYDREWTDHNPSDPGITLLELFAYLTEILLYRLNRVTEASTRKFLRLLAPDLVFTADLNADTRTAVLGVRTPFRAVTAADFERLVVEDFNQLAATQVPPPPLVARARCAAGRNLDRSGDDRTEPAHVSVVILPDIPGTLQPPQSLIDAVFHFLDERRTLTTRLHVVGPTVTPIAAEIVVARNADALDDNVRQRVADELTRFLDSLIGGPPPGEGWAFGRPVFLSELNERLEGVEGLDFVTDINLTSACAGGDPRCQTGVPVFHAEGDLIGMTVAAHGLPRLDATAIVVAPSARFVRLVVSAVVEGPFAPGVELPAIKQRIKSAVAAFFHPLHGGPRVNAPASTDLHLGDLQAALAGVGATVALTLAVDAAHRLSAAGATVGLRLQAGEVVNWQVAISEG
jgi:hypothetical protein